MFIELLTLGLDSLVCALFYKVYKERQNELEEIKKAPVYKVDSNLVNVISSHDGHIIPYAIIRGSVQAAGKALRSHHNPHIVGVIQENILKEYKTEWNSLSNLWNDVENELKKSSTSVPFHLTDDAWWKTRVEVIGADKAKELSLTTVFDQFTPAMDSFGSVLVSWISGEKSRGIREIEKMLTEGSLLTACGEIVMDNTGMKIRPPQNGRSYILTLLSPEELFEKMEKENEALKSMAIFFGFIGIFISFWYLASWYRKRKQEKENLEIQRQRDEARRRRLREGPREQGASSSNIPLCVVCMTEPVEIVVLECGHACMCLDCGSQIRNNCPMCRAPITRTITAFLP